MAQRMKKKSPEPQKKPLAFKYTGCFSRDPIRDPDKGSL